MKPNFKLFALAFFIFSTSIWSQTKSPDAFLGYELGSQYTPHNSVINYYKYVAKNNSNVKLLQYGETNEHRPLELAFITSPKNFVNLENIRQNHLKAAGLLQGQEKTDNIAIVWLSYNVHGNEASSTEASMKTLYALVNQKNSQTKDWLKNTVVIIDPCLNPDGRARYVNWYNQKGNHPYNTNPDDVEHHEPWPGGRVNHYLFDLNRDWAWITQKESAARIKIYNEWLPNIHVDFHEQGINSPYYFAPAAKPYHEVITKFQHDFQIKIGRNNAKYFDKNGWLYFTKEEFDLLYPSYGDTYPLYNGAIGMTYEQAGHSRSGLGVLTRDGEVLTLKNRIKHHFTTSLSTIEVASKNAAQLVSEFAKYYKKARTNPKGKYKSYLIKYTNGTDKISRLKSLLDAHKIKYGHPTKNVKVSGFSYQDNVVKSTRLNKNDLVINLAQPKAVLVKALFEPQTKLTDSATYDITAWALPYAHGLQAYALTSKVFASADNHSLKRDINLPHNISPYAYLAKWDDVNDAVFLSSLLKRNVKVRFANQAFKIDGKNYKAGTLIITKTGNTKLTDFNNIVMSAAKKYNRAITAVNTGFVDSGKDFGSGSVSFIKKPKIAVLTGQGVSATSFGAVWQFFEQQLYYPVTKLGLSYFNRVNLDKYNVLVIPNGYYGGKLDKKSLKKIKTWVKKGGKLIAISNAINTLVGDDDFDIQKYASDKEKSDAKSKRNAIREKNVLIPFKDRERGEISNMITGSIFKATMDNTNQLGFGYPKYYYTLKLGSNRFAYLKDGYNVSVIKSKNDLVSGFVGKNALQNVGKSLVFGETIMGSGVVVYMVDNPLFRSFWQNGKFVFCNALFFVGQR